MFSVSCFYRQTDKRQTDRQTDRDDEKRLKDEGRVIQKDRRSDRTVRDREIREDKRESQSINRNMDGREISV